MQCPLATKGPEKGCKVTTYFNLTLCLPHSCEGRTLPITPGSFLWNMIVEPGPPCRYLLTDPQCWALCLVLGRPAMSETDTTRTAQSSRALLSCHCDLVEWRGVRALSRGLLCFGVEVGREPESFLDQWFSKGGLASPGNVLEMRLSET